MHELEYMTSDQIHIGRPRSFDEDETLDRVIDLFWRKGFDGTSYSDIEAATGLHRQSLRYAFGDKAQLFKRALERYASRKIAEILSALESGATPLVCVAEALLIWARDSGINGCLVVNTLADKAAGDLPALETARHATSRLHAGFEVALRKAQAAKEIRPDVQPSVLAAQIVALGDGLMVHARGSVSPLSPEKILTAYLALLRS